MRPIEIVVPLAVLVAAWWATGRVLVFLRRRAILDRPVDRSAHAVPVPRGGGLALVPVLVLGWLVLALSGAAPPGAAPVALIAAGLAALSFLDDVRGLPIGPRLLAHLAAALVGVALLPAGAVFQGLLPPFLDRAAAALLWVWFVNLYNFMDGIDGITGVETASLGIGVALLAAGGAAGLADELGPALAAAAAALAFLLWNWHPARLFLGDVGSVALGYLLGFLLLVAASRGHWAPALILPLYYLADASLTLARRVLAGERFWEPHRAHFYQRALAPDGDHAAVAGLILAGDVVLVLMALLAEARPWLALGSAALAVAALLLRLERRARRAPAS